VALGLLAIVAVAWTMVITAPDEDRHQVDLIAQARAYLDDEIYILAVPLLEEAITFDSEHTPEMEELLKYVYLHLLEQEGFRRRYINLLNRQLNREDVSDDVFIEAGTFLLKIGRRSDGLDVIRQGIERTGSAYLIDLYEEHRYRFRLHRAVYDEISTVHGNMLAIRQESLWGFVSPTGETRIDPRFQQVSTFFQGRAVVMEDSVVFAIDMNGNRVALLHDYNVTDIGNFNNDRVALYINGQWRRGTGAFNIGAATFDQLGMYSGGFAAAKQNGRWGVIGTGNDWLIPAQYDGIVMDSAGRSFGQNAVFVHQGNSVHLYIGGNRTNHEFEDAHPFGAENYAAVKHNGLWGFINTSGEVTIDFQFEEALSFGQHIAAVRVGDYWGYINLFGDIVHEPEFLQAGSFASGSAPVLTDRGWQILTLLD